MQSSGYGFGRGRHAAGRFAFFAEVAPVRFNRFNPAMKKLLLPLFACFALVSGAFAASGPTPDISHADLKAAFAAGKVALIDVNGTDSYKEGHIPGAVDFEANEAKLAALLPADKAALVVAYCANPRCSAYKEGAAAAEKLGYTNVKHYSQGIAGWKKAGEKVETAK